MLTAYYTYKANTDSFLCLCKHQTVFNLILVYPGFYMIFIGCDNYCISNLYCFSTLSP